MSQHQIEVDSPVVGTVLVTAGYDAILSEAFLNFFNENHSYVSPMGCTVGDLQRIAKSELGIELPQQVIDGVSGDLADLRMGATDIGRRVRRYQRDGSTEPIGQ